MTKLSLAFWTLFSVETCAVAWIGYWSVPELLQRAETAADGQVLMWLAYALALALAVDAAVFFFNADKLVRRLALSALLIPVVLPTVRVIATFA